MILGLLSARMVVYQQKCLTLKFQCYQNLTLITSDHVTSSIQSKDVVHHVIIINNFTVNT